MKSKLAAAILNLEKESTSGNATADNLYAILDEIQDIERPYYDRFDLSPVDMIKHAQVVGRLAATNMQAATPDDIQMAMVLAALLSDELVQTLLAYTAKHFIILNLAEADARATAAQLQTWIVAEPTQEFPPSPTPPAEQPDGPQTTS